MAHFAELDDSNIVQRVIVVADDNCLDESGNESEAVGVQFCVDLFGGTWKQTSFNTDGGTHNDGGTPFRKNYAGVGDTYDSGRDAFYVTQPAPSWTLNETTCKWSAPIAAPDDGKAYIWDEDDYQADNSTGWVEIL